MTRIEGDLEPAERSPVVSVRSERFGTSVTQTGSGIKVPQGSAETASVRDRPGTYHHFERTELLCLYGTPITFGSIF